MTIGGIKGVEPDSAHLELNTPLSCAFHFYLPQQLGERNYFACVRIIRGLLSFRLTRFADSSSTSRTGSSSRLAHC